MSRICQLDAHVVNKIAAGEVIERPGSIVKELLENSLDALATRVDVDVMAGGTELIRIADDGEGIHPDDLLLAVTSHATSKIRTADDLFNVQTKGFRGEALASISAVSEFRFRTRQADSNSGWELDASFGKVEKPKPCGCPPGTVIEIRQLFANTPVRRKFLKTQGTEFGHISEQFARVALSHPRLHAVLRHNNKPIYELPATDQLIDRLRLFYGSKLAENLIRVESESGDVRIWGYVAHPSQSKANRKGQYLFLNGRWIQDRSLQHALTEAYRGLLMVGRQPIAFLFLEMPSMLVDVNVHPTKSEVRFRDSQQLYRLLLSTLRTKFLGMNLESGMRLPHESAAAKSVEPVDAERQRELQIDFSNWAQDALSQWKPTDNIGSLVARRDPSLSEPHETSPTRTGTDENRAGQNPVQSSSSEDVADWKTRANASIDGEPVAMPEDQRIDEAGRDLPQPHSGLQGVMQVHDCYLVAETDEGLTVIDQHALHERIIYEQLRQRVLSGSVESQRMLIPEPIELSPDEAAILLEQRDLLVQLGFGIEEFGGSTVLLSAFPPMLGRCDPTRVIRDMAAEMATAGQTPTRRDILDSLLHMMSCKAAIKAGQRLTREEMESLLEQRHLIDDAHHCPHGRPTALVLSRSELDRQFGRLG